MARKEMTRGTWDQGTEEAGTFSVASEEVLRSRIIKKARRRNVAFEPHKEGGEGAFKDFKGLVVSSGGAGFSGGKPLIGLTEGTFPDTAPPCAPAKPPVVSKPSPASTANVVTTTTVGEKSSEPKPQVSPQRPSSSSSSSRSSCAGPASGHARDVNVYFKHLASLNHSVRDWIVKHVDANPFCDLTPVFEQYAKYLATLGQQFEGGGGHPASEARKAPTEMRPPLVLGSDKLQGDSALWLYGHRPEGTSVRKTLLSEPKGDSRQGAARTIPLKMDRKHASSSQGSLSSSAPPGFSFSLGKGTNHSKPVTSAAAKALESPAQGASNEGKDGDAKQRREPPKVVTTRVKQDAFYSKKCILLYKTGKGFKQKGAGTLHLRPAANRKTQLLVKDNSKLGRVLLNILISPTMPCTRKGKNGVVIVCVPNPPLDEKDASEPATMLFQVKTREDAEGLHKILLEKKNA